MAHRVCCTLPEGCKVCIAKDWFTRTTTAALARLATQTTVTEMYKNCPPCLPCYSKRDMKPQVSGNCSCLDDR